MAWGKSPRFVQRRYTRRQIQRFYLLEVRRLFVAWRKDHLDWWGTGDAPDHAWLYDYGFEPVEEEFRLPEQARGVPHLASCFAMQDAADKERRRLAREVEKEVDGKKLRWDPEVMRQFLPGYGSLSGPSVDS